MWWLSVFFLVNGAWVSGSDISPPGWSPRAYNSEAACLARKEFAETQSREFPLELPSEWRCSSAHPRREVPLDLRGVRT